ncbi:MAG TPA: hypothetical protein QGI62_09145, partial [Anaerolineales bacterium]|nr:hypothetical protein [Anaerolineales bacterium]
RDPSGVLFVRDDTLFRQVNLTYQADYDHLHASGLYEQLAHSNLLISHAEVAGTHAISDTAYRVIHPEEITFISYPYEWCFSQLKHAALATLQIQKTALEFGMGLKDASAYNIQFRHGQPILIDTLSFKTYQEGEPWVAYRQFCQHFLAPLALMCYRDIRLSQLLRIHLDGVPLDLASALLPFRTRFRFRLLVHIHLHAMSQKYFANKRVSTAGRTVSRPALLGLVDSLETAVKNLAWTPEGTEWANYYSPSGHSYSQDAMQEKLETVSEFLAKLNPKSVWDLGANQGLYSRVVSDRGIPTVAFDTDPAAVEKNYLDCVGRSEANLLPLILDLTNPSPGIGWEGKERMSFRERACADTVMALALVHHLAISNNLPLQNIAEFFDGICNSLIIEFVPKSDPQVQRLLASRQDIFSEYTQDMFEREFRTYFAIQESVDIRGTVRTLYLMTKRPETQ